MEKNNETRNIILIVGAVSLSVAETIKNFRDTEGGGYRIALLHAQNQPIDKEQEEAFALFDITIPCNFKSRSSIVEALKPYEKELVAATCRAEANIPFYQKVVPHLSYLKVPTSESLEWATNKVEMRKRLTAYDKTITPRFKVITDSKKNTIKAIEQEIGFPLVIKPSGLAQSLLVTICYHPEELEKNLNRVFRKIESLHKETKGRGEPQVLVEQFLDGDMYSVDAYINSKGKVYFSPMVSVKTGRQVGFDDFFAYLTITPTLLNKESIALAQEVSVKAIRAIGLLCSTAHIELMKTEAGWKIIELGPRLGGFRHTMYFLSYGINSAANDIYIHIPKIPSLPKKVLGHSAVMKNFAKEEGIIITLTGLKKVQDLESFQSISIHKQLGDKALFAKHGGKSIADIYLFNKDRSKLLADIRRVEQTVNIKTQKGQDK